MCEPGATRQPETTQQEAHRPCPSRSAKPRSPAAPSLSARGGDALASGYQVREQSAVAQGVSQAGSAARGDDPSMLFLNPASQAWLTGTQVVSLVSGIFPTAETRSATTTRNPLVGGGPIAGSLGGDAGVDALVPGFYASTGLAPGFRLGVGVTSPWAS